MGFKFVELAIPLMLNLVHFTNSENFLPCTGTIIGECPGQHQVCNVKKQICECDSMRFYVMVGDECVRKDDVPSSNVGITIALSLLAVSLIVIGLVLVAKKYNLVDYVREKINARRNNAAMYEDVMIGQDDPPISL